MISSKLNIKESIFWNQILVEPEMKTKFHQQLADKFHEIFPFKNNVNQHIVIGSFEGLITALSKNQQLTMKPLASAREHSMYIA